MRAVIDLDELAVAIANDDAAAERASFARGRVFTCLQHSSSFERSPKPARRQTLTDLLWQSRLDNSTDALVVHMCAVELLIIDGFTSNR